MSNSRGGIPPRWINCPRFGELVADTFLPFKVPLDPSYNRQLPPNSYFTPDMLIDYAKHQKIDIGLWIDLTNTKRFYDKDLVEHHNIRYVKMPCRGHGECPSVDQINLFIRICSKFTTDNPGKVIAVHCTHGFNRTGFLICCYLVEQENWSIEAAISTFANARPPGIYKQDYLNELYRMFGDPGDEPIRAPILPDWCNENQDHNDDQTIQLSPNTSNGGGGEQLLEGIENIVLVTDQEKVQTIQQTCTEMCKFNLNGFPGCQPVSMTQQNIDMLKQDYLVSWKADGNRYMMLILGPNQMYFLDRHFNCYQIYNLKFFQKNSNSTKHLTNTLLDGEMVVDIVDGRRMPRYLIYDIVYCDGEDVSEKNFRERLNIIFRYVITPRDIAKRDGKIDRNQEPIGVRIKDFCELKDTHKFFAPKFQKVLSHEIDGLIFQPVNLPYLGGRCDKVLKWKPPSHNSVDFLLKIVEETRPGRVEKYLGNLYVGGRREPFAQIPVTNELRNKYNNKIIECRFNMTKNCWEFMRERTDKAYPNGLNTATNVVFSIQYPVTKEFLLDYIQKYGFR